MVVQNVDPQFSAFAAESRTASCNQNISELKVVLFMQLGSQLVVCCCSVAKHGGFGDLEASNWRYLKGVTNLFHPFKILSFVFFVSQDVVPREASAASFAQAADHSKPGPKSDLEGMSSECHDIMMSWFIIRFIIVYRPRKG